MDKALIDQALHLEPRGKLQFIEVLTHSLDEPDQHIDQEWADEAQARYASYKSGTSSSVPGADVFLQLRP